MQTWILKSSSVLTGFFIWWLVTKLAWINPLFVPSPKAVWDAFQVILHDGYKGNSLLVHVESSLLRLIIAFALTLATAIPLGLWSGYSTKVQAILDPFIEFYRPLPPLAYYTLLVLWLGIEDASKIALLFLAAFAPMYLAIVAGVKKIATERLQGASSLGANRLQLLFYVVLPSILPDLFTGIRTSIGVMYSTLVAAEMVAAVSGIGWMVLDASSYMRSDIIFLGIIIMGFIALLIDSFVRAVERTIVPWGGKTN